MRERQLFEYFQNPNPCRQTSIICTIGPKSNNVETLLALRRSGMNMIRLNFSHGDYDFHESILLNLQKSLELEPGSIGVALDTKGIEIRTGWIKNNPMSEENKGLTNDFLILNRFNSKKVKS